MVTFAPLVLALLTGGCASPGAGEKEREALLSPVADGRARVVFFRTRETGLYLARNAAMSIDDEDAGRTGFGRFHHRDVPEGRHRLRADMWDMPGACELSVTLAAGETYYFQVDPRAGSLGAFAGGDLATYLMTGNVVASLTAGLGAVAAESYGKECGGAFRLYPVDADTARLKLQSLKPGESDARD